MTDTYNSPAQDDKDRVRLLINDIGGQTGSDWIYGDDEIIEFLNLRSGSVFHAAATALRSIAANEALVSKVIKFLDIETNGEAVADALRKSAAELEQTGDDDADFEIAVMDVDMFTRRQLRGLING